MVLQIQASHEAATEQLGQDIAAILHQGMCVHLIGDLGAGKTTLSRSIIRALCCAPSLDVPSPTYTLIETYEAKALPCAHADLYRLEAPEEVEELGLEDAQADGVVLVEWPNKGGNLVPAPSLTVTISGAGERTIEITGEGAALRRLQRSLDIRVFLKRSGWDQAWREPLTGDASKRAYETILSADGQSSAILMNAPAESPGEVVKDGRSYAQIAHLALEVGPFVAVARALTEKGFCAPEIYAADLGAGLLLVEPLGQDLIVQEDGAGPQPVAERYIAAAAFLAHLHATSWDPVIDYGPQRHHTLASFSADIVLIEAELLTDWYLPFISKRPACDAARQQFEQIWRDLAADLATAPDTLLLRDYHSPNIIWRDDKLAMDRIGLIDFQDALLGPPAYDLASLGQDARVTIEADLEERMIAAYLAEADRLNLSVDEPQLRRHYAILAAQRACKVLGIFARLKFRDGKSTYLKHMPRLCIYLKRTLEHPALGALREWCEAHDVVA